MADDIYLGKITHYFDHVKVAAMTIEENTLRKGDTIKVIGGITEDGQPREVVQTVDSMEINHQNVDEASEGESVGFKIGEKVREGYKVYKIQKEE